MKYFVKTALFFSLLIFSLANSQAQIKKLKVRKHPVNAFHHRHLMYINNIRVTGMIGLSSYYGDLCDQFICFKYRPGITIGAYYRYNSRLSFRGDLTYLRLAGNDKGTKNENRNLSFRSPNLEVAGGVMYDLIKFNRNYNLRAQYTPYVFLELGMFYFNPKAQYQGEWYALRPLMTEGKKYSNITMAIPFGGGIRYKINSYMDLSFEVAYRKTLTDYIDDVSTNHIDNKSFSDPIAAALADRYYEGGYVFHDDSDDGQHWNAGHKRGNPKRKDGYFLFGFKFEYMIRTTTQLQSLNTMPRYRNRNPGQHRKYR